MAGYAEAMDLVFEAYADMRLTENHIRQLHQTLLRHSDKDARHRGSYKTLANNVVALDADGREIGNRVRNHLTFRHTARNGKRWSRGHEKRWMRKRCTLSLSLPSSS